jgi:lipopolysaccharide/colanic/teichoic acid biosynthesis glycosyltransferase
VLKRLFDILISLTGLLILLPVLLIIGLLVVIKLGSPVFFSQIRPGRGCRPFRIFKFRTMTNKTDQNGKLLPNRDRLTKFGKLLRSTSLDELPELINVLKGEMSLVGPRPLLMDYVPLFNEFQNKRHTVKPGITGWAQINGRNALTWDDKFKLDVWYVENRTFGLDLKIILLTFYKTFKREGISHEGDVAMPRFSGNPDK